MQPTHAPMKSPSSSDIFPKPLAIRDSELQCLGEILSQNRNTSPELQSTDCVDFLTSSSFESKRSDDGNDTPRELLTDLAAAANFSTGMADSHHAPVRRVPSEILVPGHVIRRRIGAGSGGCVYEALHIATCREVAIKIVAVDDTVESERFFREVRALARFHHSSVVEIYDAGECESGLYFTMELMTGGSLADLLRAAKSLTTNRAVDLCEKIATGMVEVHSRGFLHRDLKPGNILRDSNGNPKIGDFGLVKCNESPDVIQTVRELTNTAAILGTPSYMSPEQAEARHAEFDERTDVYGIGAILFHCLTGRPPFSEKTVIQVVQKIIRDEVPSPREFRPDLPIELEAICLKCLARDRSRRYRGALELAQDLNAWKNGRRVQAPLVSRWRPLKRFFIREQKPLYWAMAMVVLGFSTAILGKNGSKPPVDFRDSPQTDAPKFIPKLERAESEAIAIEVASNRKTPLLGNNGPPRYLSSSLRNLEPSRSSFGDEFCIETISRRFLPLIREQDVPDSFLLEGEISHEISPSASGRAGIYLGRFMTKSSDQQFREHWLEIVFNDAFRPNRIAGDRRFHFQSAFNITGERKTPEYFCLELATGALGKIDLSQNAVWRKFCIRVDSKQISIETWPDGSNSSFVQSSKISIGERLESTYGERLSVEPEPNRWPKEPFQGSLGLIVQQGKAAFRNFWIQKLPQAPEPK